MSQIPASALEYSTAPSAGRRNQPAPVRLPGIDQSLGVFPLATTPPASRGAALANELLQAMGQAGAISNQLGNQFYQRRRRIEQQNEKIDGQYEGQAALDSASQLPELLRAIEEREHMVPEGVKVEDYVSDLLTQQLDAVDDEGNRVIPEAYANAYRRQVQPRMIAAFVGQQQAIKAQAGDEADQFTIEAIQQAQSTDDIARFLDETRQWRPDLTDSQRLDTYIMPALRSAAATGNAEQFDRIEASLGGRFPGAATQLRQQLDATIRTNANRAEAEQYERVRDGVATRLDVEAPNYEAIHDYIDGSDIAPRRRLELKDAVRSRESQWLNEVSARQRDEFERELPARLAESLLTGNIHAASVPDDQTFQVQLANGKTAELRGKDAMEKAAPIALAAIARQYAPAAGASEAEAAQAADMILQKQVEFLSGNAPFLEAPVWKRTMTAGAHTALSSLISQSAGGGPAGVTSPEGAAGKRLADDLQIIEPTVRQGFDLYTRLGAVNAIWRDKMLDPHTRQFYRDMELSYQYMGVAEGDLRTATRNAIFAYQRRQNPTPLDAIGKLEIEKHAWKLVDRLGWNNDDANLPDIQRKLNELSSLYVMSLGMSPDAAVTAAGQDIQRTHKGINGAMVYTGGAAVPADIDGIAQVAISNYVKRFGEIEGIDARGLTLVPDASGDIWTLVHKHNLMPVARWGEQEVGSFSTRHLIAIGETVRQDAREEAERAAVAESQRQAELRKLHAKGEYTIPELTVEVAKGVPKAIIEKLTFYQSDRIDWSGMGGAVRSVGETAWERAKATPGAVMDKARRKLYEPARDAISGLWNMRFDLTDEGDQ